MSSLKLKLFTVAATLAIAATTASAQVILKASVPFSFSAGMNKGLAAGDYTIRDGGSAWLFTSQENRHTALAMARASTQSRMTDSGQLVFHCRANGCSLYAIQAARGGQGAYFGEPPRSKSDSKELARVVTVSASVSNSD